MKMASPRKHTQSVLTGITSGKEEVCAQPWLLFFHVLTIPSINHLYNIIIPFTAHFQLKLSMERIWRQKLIYID